MSDEKRTDPVTGLETTGHTWDGIEELNTPLPRWWLWVFYGCIVWGIIYVILFPAWPLVTGATGGVLGWSTRGQVADEIAAVDEANAPMYAALVDTDPAEIEADPNLHGFAVNAGASIFATYCSQCHGSGAAGAVGYPNLLDDDWLWGGTLEDVIYTVNHGIRNEDDPDARWSQMPAFGELLTAGEISTLVAHVQAMGEGTDPLSGEGGQIYADNCASCHGDDGTGDRFVGAPNLVDAIWLYGGDTATLTETIRNARFGVMPPWGERLDEAEVRAVAIYVHGLGGGEQPAAE
ncbi:cytochrome-c oxidase, cbb3-type subunit III [Rhodobacterales bacterium HKCCE2091]|nr:cytochrome-c oxidase, cbb3-type subunit III [Rhodobacterales bacterium HKCCE2091]